MRAEVRSYTAQVESVRLVGILADSGPYRADAELYSDRIAETFRADGIDYQQLLCSGETPASVEALIRDINRDNNIHGILIFYPIFKGLRDLKQWRGPFLDKSTGVFYKTQDDYLRDVVDPAKDVEGLSQSTIFRRMMFRAARARNRVLLFDTEEFYVPCTALAVLQILETYHHSSPRAMKQKWGSGVPWSGYTVTVINRSEILGRPLAALLALEGATVYSVDENSILMFIKGGRIRRCKNMTLDDCLQRSSIVVTGVPSPDFCLDSESVSPGSTVVNVSGFSNICEESLLERPDVKVIPSIGRVTVAALEQNLVRLHQHAMNQRVRKREGLDEIGKI